MKVSAEDVKHIAQLSRLTVPASEMEVFTEQFNQILNYADILEKIDTAGIEPTPYVLPVSNVLRAQELEKTMAQTSTARPINMQLHSEQSEQESIWYCRRI